MASGNKGKSGQASGLPVAYIMEDSLMNHYVLFKDLEAQMMKKQQDLENSYQTRAQNLQQEIDNYRQRAGSMAPKDAQNKENELMQKQQNLYQYQQTLNQEMTDEQQKVNDQLYQKVSDFLKDYAAQKGYKIVLNYKRGSGMLYGTGMLDITNDVIRGLNEQYVKENSMKANSPASKDASGK